MSGEDKLKQGLEQLHRRDEAPAFDLMWRRAQAQARARKPGSARLRLALGAGLVAAVALAVWLTLPGAPEVAPTPTPAGGGQPVLLASLSSWQGPTDFLLETTGADLLRGAIQFGAIESLGVPNLRELHPVDDPTTTIDGGTNDQNHP